MKSEKDPEFDDLAALKGACHTLLDLGVGDFIYNIRDREGEGWDGPEVKAWAEACETLRKVVGS
jgi:hypothetical protein